jgi:hypothetical protein
LSRYEVDHTATEAVAIAARRAALEEAAAEVLGHALVEVPVRDGNLRRQHRLGDLGVGAAEIRVENHADYAAAVHEGSVAHDIPNAFGWGITVEHPGNDANPWLRRAMDRAAGVG